MENLSHENEFDLYENEPVGGPHFHMNGFARRLINILTQRQKTTREWPTGQLNQKNLHIEQAL